MSPRLVLQFLGLPQVHLDDQPVAADRRKAIALLAYLAVSDSDPSPQRYSRESLSALFWPDYEQAKAFSNLRRTIWEVHQALGEGWLNADRESVQLDPKAEIDLDVARFQDLVSQGRRQSDPGRRIPLLLEATKLYHNHFLTGFSLKDAYSFNEWAYAQSEDLRQKLAGALETLSDDYCVIGEAEKAIPYARRLITLDPLNEAAHCRLMEVYLQAGQHSAALKQYQTCEQILRKELGLDPQPETLALYKKIRKGERKPAPAHKPVETISPRHNLPSQLSSFIGREKEQAAIGKLLAKNRLVTLTGTGGIGKTSLALQVSHKLLREYPDGVWFVALDSLSDPDLVPQTVAAVFDIRETRERPVVEVLVHALRGKTALLLLDNCEHLLQACASLATILLTNCPQLKILATSREVLNVAGEATYRAPSLSMPARTETSFEKLSEYESIHLFSERAALALPSFTLTPESAQAVIDICRKVDGIPLAIELAAARVNILQVPEILEQLQGSFALLSMDHRMASSRHQTLQASLDWSWGLLSAAEQTFLLQLAVFAGGWTLESAQAICDGDVLALTDALVKKSLIGVKQEAGRGTRYRFHEMVRQYAHGKLIESGAEGTIRTRHLNYFLQLSEEAEPALRGPAQIEEWLTHLHEERDNVRLALAWADKTDMEAGLYITGRLQGFWESLNMREGAHWMNGFLQKPASIEYPHARAKALYALGVLLLWSQDFVQATSVTEESLALFRQCGDQHGEADALILLGFDLHHLDERKAADKLYEQSLALARSMGDARRQALALFRLGYDRPDRQLAYWEQAIALFRSADDRSSMASLLCATARFRILLTGDIERAQQDLDEAARSGSVRNRNIAGLWEEARFAKSLIAQMRGDYEEAHTLLVEIRTPAEESGNWMGYLWASAHLGYIALRAGNLTEARTIFAETAQNFQKDKSTIGVAFTLEGLASLCVAVGKAERAAYLIGWTDATRERILNPRPFLEQADVDKAIAACLARLGEASFSDAHEEGQKMTMDEAVALALKEN